MKQTEAAPRDGVGDAVGALGQSPQRRQVTQSRDSLIYGLMTTCMSMLKLVYVYCKKARYIVTIGPKAPFRPVLQVRVPLKKAHERC